MTLSVTVIVPEGIVMASDSRAFLNGEHSSDKAEKIFIAPNNIGIAITGWLTLDGKKLISECLKEFYEECLLNELKGVNEIPQLLVNFFGKYPTMPATEFFIGGYTKVDTQEVPQLWKLILSPTSPEVISSCLDANDPYFNSIKWQGNYDILSRIYGSLRYENDEYPAPQNYNINCKQLNLKDAIDFVHYAFNTVIQTMRFQDRVKNVGGPIKLLIIKPKEAAYWL